MIWWLLFLLETTFAFIWALTQPSINQTRNEHSVKRISSVRRFFAEDASKASRYTARLLQMSPRACTQLRHPTSQGRGRFNTGSAARLAVIAAHPRRSTSLLHRLHWLPISERSWYTKRVRVLSWHFMVLLLLSYFSELLYVYTPFRTLCSSSYCTSTLRSVRFALPLTTRLHSVPYALLFLLLHVYTPFRTLCSSSSFLLPSNFIISKTLILYSACLVSLLFP